MQMSVENMVARADDLLLAAGRGVGRAERIESFKRFLKVETGRLKMRHRCGLGGIEVARLRSSLIDLLIRRAFAMAVATDFASGAGGHSENDRPEDSLAVVAIGGYGRGELAPFSDIDILFLHQGRKAGEVKRLVERVLYLLWDVRLSVGHSFRSVQECFAMAKEDLHSRTALSDARLLAGSESLLNKLSDSLESGVYSNKRERTAFLDAIRLEIESRYEKFGLSVCVQEPNIKEGPGGLRDLHAIGWLGHGIFGAKSMMALADLGWISAIELSSLRRAHEFLTRVRNEAHFEVGRKSDLLLLDMQPEIAHNLGYTRTKGMLASEVFMRDLYCRGRELHEISADFLRRCEREAGPRPQKSGLGLKQYLKRGFGRRGADHEGFEAADGELVFAADTSHDSGDPMTAIRIFSAAELHGVRLSDPVKQALKALYPSVGRRFRASAEASTAFLQMLERKGRVGFLLRTMHETGFLGRYVPEFGRISLLVQHDSYHRYTVDEHSLRAVEALDRLASTTDDKLAPLAKVYSHIRPVAPLYLAMLLHDVGKGQGGGHVQRGVKMTEKVVERLGLDQESAKRVIFLVQNHLQLSQTSQRRDLSEDSLIDEFVASAESLDNLNMLVLLTYADMSAVAPGIWNDWRASLVLELYFRALARFTGDIASLTDADRVAEEVAERLGGKVFRDEVDHHLTMMPEKYVRAFSADEIARHIGVVRNLGGLAADWRTLDDKHCTELTIFARDTAGLFADLAGTLSVNGVNILSADLYTREDGIVVDTFRVCEVNSLHPVRPRHWPRIEEKLRGATEGTFDVSGAFDRWGSKHPPGFGGRRGKTRRGKPAPAVTFDQSASTCNTVVEVSVEDEPGLAYRISSCLASAGLNINFATIATEKSRVLDIFYVTDSAGLKLTDSELPAVRNAVLKALSRAQD